jgi:hypothetical protein
VLSYAALGEQLERKDISPCERGARKNAIEELEREGLLTVIDSIRFRLQKQRLGLA